MCVYVSRHYRVGGIAECAAVRERSVELIVCVRVCFKALQSWWYCRMCCCEGEICGVDSMCACMFQGITELVVLQNVLL